MKTHWKRVLVTLVALALSVALIIAIHKFVVVVPEHGITKSVIFGVDMLVVLLFLGFVVHDEVLKILGVFSGKKQGGNAASKPHFTQFVLALLLFALSLVILTAVDKLGLCNAGPSESELQQDKKSGLSSSQPSNTAAVRSSSH